MLDVFPSLNALISHSINSYVLNLLRHLLNIFYTNNVSKKQACNHQYYLKKVFANFSGTKPQYFGWTSENWCLAYSGKWIWYWSTQWESNLWHYNLFANILYSASIKSFSFIFMIYVCKFVAFVTDVKGKHCCFHYKIIRMYLCKYFIP